MKTNGSFTYWFNNEELKDFDAFERKIKDKEVVIEVNKLRIDARTKEI